MRFKTTLRTSSTSSFSTLNQGFPFWIESGGAGELGNHGNLHPSLLKLSGSLPEAVNNVLAISPIGLPFFKESGDNEIACNGSVVVKCYYYGSKDGSVDSALADIVTTRLLHYNSFKIYFPFPTTDAIEILIPVTTPNATTSGLASAPSRNYILRSINHKGEVLFDHSGSSTFN